MNISKKVASALVVLALTQATSATAAIIQVPIDVTLRDFTFAHPDFDNSGTTGLVTGMVGSMLDANGVPIYNPGSGGAVQSASTFSTWYNGSCDANTPGVTCVAEYTKSIVTNVNTDTGELTYANSFFFPLDSLTDVTNDGDSYNNHNYSFTAQFELDLIFNAANTNTFSFTGDDDVWVFINNELVLDLGGIRPAVTDGFNMNTVATNFGISEGEQYTLSFFFAERHYSESTVNITSFLGEIQQVPEPTGIAAFGLALLGLRRFARK